jgi:hypothetical protein
MTRCSWFSTSADRLIRGSPSAKFSGAYGRSADGLPPGAAAAICWLAAAAEFQFGWLVGSSTLKVAPFPGSEWSEIRPPMRLTSSRVM